MSYNSGKKLRIGFNSPCVLTFAAICVIVQILNTITGDAMNRLLFTVGGRSFANPLTYVNCILHIFGHSGWDHMLSNMMYFLLLGPMLEEKYGTRKLIFIIFVTGFVTGLIKMLLFPNVILCGASGVVFAMILLCSMTQIEEHSIPLTLILVAVMYLGREIYSGLFVNDNVSQAAHILGGSIGTVFGFILNRNATNRYKR